MGRQTRRIDVIALITIFCIGIFGLFLLLTIYPALFLQQLFFLGMSFVIMIALSTIDPTLIKWFSPIGYILALVFLGVSFFGPSIRGATRWIFIGSVQIQPSEVVKPFLLLAFANWMERYPPRTLRNVLLHTGLFAVPFFLVFRQPDLGSSIVYAITWICMMIAGGLPILLTTIGTSIFIVVFPFLWNMLAVYQRTRILTFFNPNLDPQGAGYNAIQSMIAIGSGQLFGKGLGLGTQSHLLFLPEFHTDFIFAALVEELGFIGGGMLLFAYFLLLSRIFLPVLKGEYNDIFRFSYNIGLICMLLSQISINTGMNMGIIPVTGITLPLVSYGGSSLLSVAVSFGIAWALRSDKRQEMNIANRKVS